MNPSAIAPTATNGPSGSCDTGRGCITCADEGVAMRVITVGEDDLGACAGPDGAREVVDLALVAPVGPGDEVLVHAGVALVRLGDEAIA
jgi:hydrogenase maturation factor